MISESLCDIIIIGRANGLVIAAYLAKQGKQVLVLERRAIVCGLVVTESFGDVSFVDSRANQISTQSIRQNSLFRTVYD